MLAFALLVTFVLLVAAGLFVRTQRDVQSTDCLAARSFVAPIPRVSRDRLVVILRTA